MYFAAWISEQSTAHRLCPLLEFWPCFLLFSALAHPPAVLAAWFLPCCLPLLGDPLSLGHPSPRFLHSFPHPSPPPSMLKGHVLRRPDLPLRPAVSSPPTPPPWPFSTRLGNVPLCASAVTVSLPVLHWPLHTVGVGGLVLCLEQSRCSVTVRYTLV